MVLDNILLTISHKDKDRLPAIESAVVDVAGPAGATVTIAHVCTSDRFETILDQLNYDPQSDPDPDEVAERLTFVEEIAKTLDANDISSDIRGVISEEVGEAIVSLAKEIDADRVFVGGRTRSPTGKALFGSTAQEVLLTSPCPVTFVKKQ